jgi:hypothetical protein
MIKPVEIVVDRGFPGDPVAGTTDCVLPAFAGQQLYVEKIGYGTYDADKYQELSGGGFRLLGAGNVFVTGERWVIHFTGLSYGTGLTSYTNGFNFSQVMSALYGRVGWDQPEDGPALGSINRVSKSGRYFNQGFHELVTIDNILEVMQPPNADEDQVNIHLEALQRGVILKCVNSIFKAPEYLTQKVLFNRNWSINDQPIENKGMFVYGTFRMPPKVDIGVQIDQVSLFFDSDVTFNMYVFHDAIKAPLMVFEVDAIADTQTLVTIPDLILNYIGTQSLGGTFYIGYFQDDLGDAKAYYESYMDRACDYYWWSFGEADVIPGQYNFVRRAPRLNNVNYGLNFHVSTFRDHTQQIVKQAALFDNAIGLSMAAQVVEKIIYSTRSNGTERILKESLEVTALLDLNGVAPIPDSPYTTGLKKQLAEEFKSMRESFFPPKKSIIANYAKRNY